MTDRLSAVKSNNIPVKSMGISPSMPQNAINSVFDASDNTNKVLTEADLHEKFKEVLKQYNIEYSEKDLGLILSAFTKYSTAELLKLSDEEIIKIINKAAKDYKISLSTGWSLDGVAKQQKSAGKKGLSERLEGFSSQIKEKGFANVSEAEQKRAIKAFFGNYFNNLKGKSHDEIVRLQIQTFGRILINSSEEEKTAFKEVVKNLLSENISQGLKEVLESLDIDNNKTAFANSFTADDIIEISESKDYYGNKVTDDELKDITATITSYKDAEHIEADHEIFNKRTAKFINEHKEELDIIKNKIDNCEELTDEEQQLLNELKRHQAISSGEMAGTANNIIITGEDRTCLLNLMNEDNYNLGEDYYRDVIEGIKSYVDEHSDELNISLEEFNEILDNVTNYNYSNLSNDINAQINPPASNSSQETSTNNNGLGFTNGDKPNVNPNPSTCYVPVDDTPKLVLNDSPPLKNEYNTKYINDLLYSNNPEELNKFKKKVGNFEFVKVILNSSKKGSLAYKIAKNCFENLCTAMKIITFGGIHNTSNAIDIAQTMDISELEKIKGQNIYITKQVDNIKEDKEELLQK